MHTRTVKHLFVFPFSNFLECSCQRSSSKLKWLWRRWRKASWITRKWKWNKSKWEWNEFTGASKCFSLIPRLKHYIFVILGLSQTKVWVKSSVIYINFKNHGEVNEKFELFLQQNLTVFITFFCQRHDNVIFFGEGFHTETAFSTKGCYSISHLQGTYDGQL